MRQKINYLEELSTQKNTSITHTKIFKRFPWSSIGKIQTTCFKKVGKASKLDTLWQQEIVWQV